MAESFHVMHTTTKHPVALPITFYISEEIMEDDESISDEHLASLLQSDLVLAIHELRKRRRDRVDARG